MVERSGKNGSVRDEVVTFRVRSEIASELKNLALERNKAVSALMQDAAEEIVASRGKLDPKRLELREVEINTAAAIDRFSQLVLMPYFDRLNQHVAVLEHFSMLLTVMRGEAKNLSKARDSFQAFFDALDYTVNYDPPERSLAEEIKSATANGREALKNMPAPIRMGYCPFGLMVPEEVEQENSPGKEGTAKK